MNELDGGMVRERGRHAREGRLLALFDANCGAATAGGAAAEAATMAPVAARHWLTVEWPPSELQRSLPAVFAP